MRICEQCGGEVDGKSRFCKHCGAQISDINIDVFEELPHKDHTIKQSHDIYNDHTPAQTDQNSPGAQKKPWQKKWREMNKQEKKKFSIIIAAMLIVGFTIFGLGVWMYVDAFYGDGASAGGFTYSDFQEIRNGMSYQQVCDILGDKGEVQSESSSMGYTMAFYVWERDYPSYANIVVCFENGRVSSKSQLGL